MKSSLFALFLILSIAACGVLLLIFPEWLERSPGPEAGGPAVPVDASAFLERIAPVESFSIGRYPASVDARQSQPVIAPVTGFLSFLPEAFGGSLKEGVLLGRYEHQLSVRSRERAFLAGEFEQLKKRIALMGDLERERRLRTMASSIATTREQIELLKTIEKNPDLEATLFSASSLGIPEDSTAESVTVSLQLLEAEYALLQGQDPDEAAERRSFEVETKLSELDNLIDSLSLEMPFSGSFTPNYPEDALGRTIPVKAGDVLGLATDTSAIFLSVVSTDPDLALIDEGSLAARVRVGGRDIGAEFSEKSMVQVQDRAVPVYRFRLTGDLESIRDLAGSQVSCELLQLTGAPVRPVQKLSLVQLASQRGIEVGRDWGQLVDQLFPGAGVFAETRSELILTEKPSK